MTEGKRKTIVFYNVLYTSLALLAAAMITGKVDFTGAQILDFFQLITLLSIAFFAANVGEHFSRKLLNRGGDSAQQPTAAAK